MFKYRLETKSMQRTLRLDSPFAAVRSWALCRESKRRRRAEAVVWGEGGLHTGEIFMLYCSFCTKCSNKDNSYGLLTSTTRWQQSTATDLLIPSAIELSFNRLGSDILHWGTI